MKRGLIVIYFSEEDLSDYRIGEIGLHMRKCEGAVYLVVADSEKSFNRYIDLLGKDLIIYNRHEYLSSKRIMKLLWGFSSVWLCGADDLEEYKIQKENPNLKLVEPFPGYPRTLVPFAV